MSTVTPAGWRDRAGSWLGIGASPAALVLGAGLAARNGGAIPLAPVVLGVVLMVLVLAGQGALGLAPPNGTGRTLTSLAPLFLAVRARMILGVLLAVAMIGWFGFNIGLGGAALGALLGAPVPVAVLCLAVPVWLVSSGGMGRWNRLAVVATGAALLAGAVIASRIDPPLSPVSMELGTGGSMARDVAGFVGYVAVFGVRAPDFSVGLRHRSDLAASITLLVGPFLVMVGLGAMLYRSTGSADLVGTLSGPDGMALGNLLVAVAVIGPAFTTTYSGALALDSLGNWSSRWAIAAIAGPGTVLAVLRFDRYLLPWLGVLAAALPALVVPMALEGRRRRRGHPPRIVPVWTWAPAAGLASLANLFEVALAPVLALLAAALLSAGWAVRLRRAPRSGSTAMPER